MYRREQELLAQLQSEKQKTLIEMVCKDLKRERDTAKCSMSTHYTVPLCRLLITYYLSASNIIHLSLPLLLLLRLE